MNQNRNFEVFVKKFKLTINALAESNYRKAHSHSVLALNSFYDYAYELDGLEYIGLRPICGRFRGSSFCPDRRYRQKG